MEAWLQTGQVTIASDRDLIAAVVLADAGLLPAGSPLPVATATSVPVVDSSQAFFAPAAPPASAQALVSTVVVTPNAASTRYIDAAIPFIATITVALDPPASGSVVCETLPPHQSIPCLLPTFAVASHLIQAGGLRVSVRSAAMTGSVATSNQIPTQRFEIQELSNIRADRTLSDSISGFVATQDELVFFGYDGVELHQYLYRPASHTLTDLVVISIAGNVLPMNGKLYMNAKLASGVYKTQAYDPVGGAFEQVADTRQDNTLSEEWWGPGLLHQGSIYFVSESTAPSALRELHRIRADGTVERLSATGGNPDDSGQVTACDGRVIFTSRQVCGWSKCTKVFAFDSTTTTVTKVADFSGSSASHDWPIIDGGFGGFVYLSASGPGGAYKEYAYDCTTGQTAELPDTIGDNTASTPVNPLALYRGRLFFRGLNGNGQLKYYFYDPSTGEGEQPFGLAAASLPDDPGGSVPAFGTAVGDELYFRAANTQGQSKLYLYDETRGLLRPISNTSGDAAVADDPRNALACGSGVCFVSHDGSGQRTLYRYDRSLDAVVRLHAHRVESSPQIVAHGALYFFGFNALGGGKLFRMCESSCR